MGEVLIKYRVMPDGPETDLAALQGALAKCVPSDTAKLSGCEAKPFAFGMKVLIASFVVQDEEGNADKVEEAVRAVAGVQGVELLDMGRLM